MENPFFTYDKFQRVFARDALVLIQSDFGVHAVFHEGFFHGDIKALFVNFHTINVESGLWFLCVCVFKSDHNAMPVALFDGHVTESDGFLS